MRRFIRDDTSTPSEAISDAYLDRDAPGSYGTIGNIKTLTGGATSSFNGNRTWSDIYELTSIGSTPLTQSYNLDGQVATMHNGNELQWDAAGRLKQVDNNTDIYNYGYDCDGRRVWKKEQGAATFTVYCYGGPNVISEFTITIGSPDAAALAKEFVYGSTIDELLLVDSGSTQLGITRNQQWSVVAAYNYGTGAIVGRFNYDLFGKRFILDDVGALATNQNDDFGIPYGYTSRRHYPESELMYFRARYYDPVTGEFISQDPLEYVDGTSMYRGYFIPRNVDPTGLVCIECVCQLPGSAPKITVKTDCGGLATTCCSKACPKNYLIFNSWTGTWNICGAKPDNPGPDETCPTDWRNTNNMLDCVGCCVKATEVVTIVERGVECYTAARPLKPIRPNGTIDVLGNSVKRWQFSWTVNSTEHCMTRTYLKCGVPRETIRCLNRFCVYYTIVEGFVDIGRITYCTEACRRKFANQRQ